MEGESSGGFRTLTKPYGGLGIQGRRSRSVWVGPRKKATRRPGTVGLGSHAPELGGPGDDMIP